MFKSIGAMKGVPSCNRAKGHGVCVLLEVGEMMMDPILCSIADAAKMLGVGRSKAWQLVQSNQLETMAIGRRRLVRIDSIRAFARGEAA